MIDVEMHYSVLNEVNPERSRRVTDLKERLARALFLLSSFPDFVILAKTEMPPVWIPIMSVTTHNCDGRQVYVSIDLV